MLFREFLRKYGQRLQLEKLSPHKHSRYTWYDKDYRDYIVLLLSKLEPRFEKPEITVIYELE